MPRPDLGRSRRALAMGQAMESTIALTARETDVLLLLARGRTYVQVADELGVSLNTVASHVKNLYRKLGVRSARGAVWRAFELRLLGRPRVQDARDADSEATTRATPASADSETSTVIASAGGSSAAN
jgi:DNA-binding CsgD family transcriptional regulator